MSFDLSVRFATGSQSLITVEPDSLIEEVCASLEGQLAVAVPDLYGIRLIQDMQELPGAASVKSAGLSPEQELQGVVTTSPAKVLTALRDMTIAEEWEPNSRSHAALKILSESCGFINEEMRERLFDILESMRTVAWKPSPVLKGAPCDVRSNGELIFSDFVNLLTAALVRACEEHPAVCMPRLLDAVPAVGWNWDAIGRLNVIAAVALDKSKAECSSFGPKIVEALGTWKIYMLEYPPSLVPCSIIKCRLLAKHGDSSVLPILKEIKQMYVDTVKANFSRSAVLLAAFDAAEALIHTQNANRSSVVAHVGPLEILQGNWVTQSVPAQPAIIREDKIIWMPWTGAQWTMFPEGGASFSVVIQYRGIGNDKRNARLVNNDRIEWDNGDVWSRLGVDAGRRDEDQNDADARGDHNDNEDHYQDQNETASAATAPAASGLTSAEQERSDAEVLLQHQDQLQKALLASKAEGPPPLSADDVVLFRLTRFSHEIREALATSLALDAINERVTRAGCETRPSFAAGAHLFVPVTADMYSELGLAMQPHHVLAWRGDRPAIEQALRDVPATRRPKIRNDHRADKIDQHRVTQDASTPAAGSQDKAAPDCDLLIEEKIVNVPMPYGTGPLDFSETSSSRACHSEPWGHAAQGTQNVHRFRAPQGHQ